MEDASMPEAKLTASAQHTTNQFAEWIIEPTPTDAIQNVKVLEDLFMEDVLLVKALKKTVFVLLSILQFVIPMEQLTIIDAF